MASKQIIKPANSAPAVGPYNHAVRVGDLLFCAGQIPIDPATGNLVDGDIAAQTLQVFHNLGEILKAAGASFDHVVRSTVYLADMNDFATVNEIYGTYFASPAPARATVQAARLPRDARVEIDVIAFL